MLPNRHLSISESIIAWRELRLNTAAIESQVRELIEKPFDPDTFMFELIEAYGPPKATLTKLRQGSANYAVRASEVLWKKKLFYNTVTAGSVAEAADAMAGDPLVAQHRPRFILASDGVRFYGRDLKLDETLDVDLASLDESYRFLLPLVGYERHRTAVENPADVKAAGRLAKLHDAILLANPTWNTSSRRHELNLFMTRILFCFFAEDIGIFEAGLFVNSVLDLSREDGSDTSQVLESLFTAVNTPGDKRRHMGSLAKRFPYVNGGLFAEKANIPQFSQRARRLLKECGELNWQDIHPDIFGSMIQTVVEPGMRGDMGMHYTSVPNILKVLAPLFLISLEDAFEASRESEAKLRALLRRIYNIRVFDPACGSGNFLIIAYRKLRELEMRIFDSLMDLTNNRALPLSGIRLSQFYGLELADFAIETAKLSLWIAECQMNARFKDTFGACPPSLPLRDSGNILCKNALRSDWLAVVPRKTGSETYVVGNPPYLGRGQRTAEQNKDMEIVFSHKLSAFKMLDYVACFVLKAAQYCKEADAQSALVTTNSICQGEQVALLWPLVFALGLKIGFAHRSFKWKNNAANNAGVTCVIVGLRNQNHPGKTLLYSGEHSRQVKDISPYLTEGDGTIVVPIENARTTKAPIMSLGNQPTDNGNLILSAEEKSGLVALYPEASSLLRRFYGSEEFIHGLERWCLWITDDKVDLANSVPPIQARIQRVKEFRLASKAPTTVAKATTPYRFIQIQDYGKDAIIIPAVSSERRRYLPVGSVGAEAIIGNAAFAIYEPPPYLFAILASRLHFVWALAVGGHLEERIRYANTLIYNTFPVPELSDAQRATLGRHAAKILAAQGKHPGKTIAWLYDPKTMPDDVARAHSELDEALEQIYFGRSLQSDDERLEHLLRLYATASGQGNQPDLFSKERPKLKGRKERKHA